MTISPILQNRLNINTNGNKPNNLHHERIYENLKQHANDVKPNDPKAKLVKEGPIKRTASAVKDNFNDVKNFFKATKTGKMNDNNLGRINDLGMKAGALLIASFLAAHAKTKTEAIMQFIGGTTFFASMALWPKIFINLPARIIHGFPIDEKYISAQGDKKDLYLDNQFIPTGLHSKEQKIKEMKRMGINPEEPSAEEKWLRKRQKTALQNRTLWMATAGFATPLMTALIGNYVQPKVENAVIEHEFKKANEILSNQNALNAYLIKQQDLSNVKDLEALFAEFKGKELTDAFYDRLAKLLQLDNILDKFKNPDDRKPLEQLKSNNLTETLRKIREQKCTIDIDSLKEVLRNTEKPSASSLLVGAAKAKLTEEEINTIISRLGEEKTLERLRQILKESGIAEKQESKIITSIKVNNESFFEAIRNYNSNILSRIKGRIKAYLSILNPVAGSKSESITTRQYNRIINELIEKLGIQNYDDLKTMKTQTVEATQELIKKQILSIISKDTEYEEKLHQFFEITQRFIEGGKTNSESYRRALEEAFGKDFPLVKNTALFDNFKYNIQANNKAWMMEIFDQYSTEIADAPKRTSIRTLNLQGLNKAQEDAFTKLFDTSTLMKLFTVTQDDKTCFEKLDQLTQAINTYLGTKNEGNQAAEKLKETLKRILGPNNKLIQENEFQNFITYIEKDNYVWINEIIKGKDVPELTHAILGGKQEPQHIFNTLTKYLKNKKTDIDFTRVKALICANFERRVKEGIFEQFGDEGIEAARKIIYDGCIATRNTAAEMHNKENYNNLINAIFNAKAFQAEKNEIPEIENIIKALKEINRDFGKHTEKTLQTSSISEQIKNFATKLFNNKSWLKIFAPMAIGLVAITLLAQPLFGKIKKEYPENKKTGGAK